MARCSPSLSEGFCSGPQASVAAILGSGRSHGQYFIWKERYSVCIANWQITCQNAGSIIYGDVAARLHLQEIISFFGERGLFRTIIWHDALL
jgi:hypothetical protein